MTDPDDPLGDIAERYVAYLAGESPTPPDLSELDDANRRRAEDVCGALAAAWQGEALVPPLEADPIAISLGLLPDPNRPLDGEALRNARKHARLSVSDLAGRLQARGWQTRTREVYEWEGQPAAEVPPAIIAALAEELAVPAAKLTGRPAELSPTIMAVTSSGRFQTIARRWAAVLGLSGEAQGAVALRQLMLTGVVRRGDDLDVDAWLDAIEALVRARESRRSAGEH
jgi:hypothetical protein